MSNPRKIKVKRVEAADRAMQVTLESENAGEPFTKHVRVKATVVWNTAPHIGQGINPNVVQGTMEATVDVLFPEPSFGPNQALDYTVTNVWFSTDGVGWVEYSGAIGNASGTVTSGAN